MGWSEFEGLCFHFAPWSLSNGIYKFSHNFFLEWNLGSSVACLANGSVSIRELFFSGKF